MTSSVAQQIIVGVDTHKDVHVAAAIDVHGRLLGHHSVATVEKGCSDLHQWALTPRRGCDLASRALAHLALVSPASCRPRGVRCWRSADPTANCVGTGGSPAPSTRRPPLALCWRGL